MVGCDLGRVGDIAFFAVVGVVVVVVVGGDVTSGTVQASLVGVGSVSKIDISGFADVTRGWSGAGGVIASEGDEDVEDDEAGLSGSSEEMTGWVLGRRLLL